MRVGSNALVWYGKTLFNVNVNYLQEEKKEKKYLQVSISGVTTIII